MAEGLRAVQVLELEPESSMNRPSRVRWIRIGSPAIDARWKISGFTNSRYSSKPLWRMSS